MIVATATEVKNNFGKYLNLVLQEGELQITKHKTVIAKIVAEKPILEAEYSDEIDSIDGE